MNLFRKVTKDTSLLINSVKFMREIYLKSEQLNNARLYEHHFNHLTARNSLRESTDIKPTSLFPALRRVVLIILRITANNSNTLLYIYLLPSI